MKDILAELASSSDRVTLGFAVVWRNASPTDRRCEPGHALVYYASDDTGVLFLDASVESKSQQVSRSIEWLFRGDDSFDRRAISHWPHSTRAPGV